MLHTQRLNHNLFVHCIDFPRGLFLFSYCMSSWLDQEDSIT